MTLWNQEDENKLKEYVSQGLTYLQISKLLKKTKNSVLGKANRLKLAYVVKKNKPKKDKKPYINPYQNYTPRVFSDAPKSLELTIEQLEKNNCRYIAGTDRRFCGHKKAEKSSYCEYHTAICCISL